MFKALICLWSGLSLFALYVCFFPGDGPVVAGGAVVRASVPGAAGDHVSSPGCCLVPANRGLHGPAS